ncbi:MAG: PQQ-binding-like beta-propeller repeat protein, partial [Chloroflexota bacterium]|nr:PQQ-binding-like beta-propeller repeat protein [Chloroflexota bacterium]
MFTAIYRRLGPRGALIAWIVGVALVIALVVGLLGLAINLVQPPSQPSPSTAVVTMTYFDGSSGKTVLAPVSARDGSTIQSVRTYMQAGFSATANGMYYAQGWMGSPGPTIGAWRLSDGAQQWSVTPSDTGNARALLVADNLLFYATGSPYDSSQETLVAVDATTGARAWNVNLPGIDLMANIVPQAAANASMVFVGSFINLYGAAPSVVAIRVADGSIAWTQTLSTTTASRQVGALRLSGYGNGPGRRLVASADSVYAANNSGAVTALRAADGAVAWQSHAASPANIGAMLTYGGVGLYVCQFTNGNAQNPLLAL